NLRFIHANERLAEILGYPRDELAGGLPFKQVFVGPAYEVVRTRLQERLAGHTTGMRYECVARRRDGDPIELEIFGSRMYLHGRPALIGIMFDITERRRAEASARRAALVYAHTSEAMVVTDADGVIQDINPAFTAVTGYSAEEVVGRTMAVLSSGRHDQAFYQAMWAQLHETGRWSGDIHNRRKSGGRIRRTPVDQYVLQRGWQRQLPHRPVLRRDREASARSDDLASGTLRSPDPAAQSADVPGKPATQHRAQPGWRIALCPGVPGSGSFQGSQRSAGPRGGRPTAAAGGPPAERMRAQFGHGGPAGRR